MSLCVRSAFAVAVVSGLAVGVAGAQTIEWAAPVSGNWNLAANWSPDRLPNATDSVLIGGVGMYEVAHNAPSGSILELAITNPDATLGILGGRTVTINGGLLNNGLLVLNSNGANATTTLYFSVDASILGDGLLRLNRSSNQAQLRGGLDVVVTNGPSHTIAGYGIFSTGIVNNGTIDADVENQTFSVGGPETTNNALMTATAGTLALFGTIVQGAQGLILADGGEVLIGQGAFIDGGQLASEPGSRVVRSYSGSSWLRDVSFSGTMDIFGGSTTSVFGAGLTNNGVITVNANGSDVATVFRFSNSGSLGGSGVVRLNRSSTRAQLTSSNRVVVTHGSSHMIAGFGQISAELINNGTINADVENQTLRVTGSAKTNNALMAASAGTLELLGVTIAQSAQGAILADGGEVLIGSDVVIDAGQLGSEAGSRVVRSTGTSTLRNVSFSGTMDTISSSTLAIAGAGLTNDGVITVNANGSSATTTIRFEESGLLGGTGVVRLNNAGTLAHLTTAQNVSVEIGENQTVTGIGRIDGEFTLRGATAPGLQDPGTMEFNGDITLAPTHTLDIRIAGPSSSTNNYDRITGSAITQLGGTLSVEFVDNYEPDFGQSYTILTGAPSGVSGEFAEFVASEPLATGLVYRIVYEPNRVLLNVTCIADMNADFVVDADDFFEFLSLFASGDLRADMNNDGVIDADDFFQFLNLFAAGC